MSKRGAKTERTAAKTTEPTKPDPALARAVASLGTPTRTEWDLHGFFFGPQPIVRLEILRILIPLCILGFMSSRLIHVDHWIGASGFNVPDLGHSDYRQPLAYLAPLSNGLAWTVAALMVVSGLMVAAGAYTRLASGVFAVLLFYVALADRLAAFTVSKIGAVLALALFLTPCGARYGIDAWRRFKAGQTKPTLVAGGSVRFFQFFVPIFYFASGLAKYRGSWGWGDHYNNAVIWTHLHDSYQTAIAYWAGKLTPSWGWTVFQMVTLAFEMLAPIWFALKWTRPYALVYGLGMHLMIGLMFGPVIWFSLLMMSLLIGCYLPARMLDRIVFSSAQTG